MNFNTLKEVVRFRITESEENYWIEDYWKAAAKMFVLDINASIAFIKNECTDEEFFWLSEVFEDVAEKTQSKEFIQALRDRLSKVTPEEYNQQAFESEHMRKWIDYPEFVRSVSLDIDYAEGTIRE